LKREIVPILKRNDVEFVGLFGSLARGEGDAESDIDFLVRFRKPKSLLEIISLEQELSDIAGRKVEIITEGSLHPYLAPFIYKDLKPFYGK
jgi:predicted nucleotidyltransferase